MMKYWVYLEGEVPGSYEAEELVALPGFNETAMVCPASGGLMERNWKRAGQIPDLIEALNRRTGPKPPLAPFPPSVPVSIPGEPGDVKSPNDVLTDSSHKIFAHVTELMKELENRRAERALTQSLQRQLIELKNEVLALRERNQYLQEHADLLPAYVDREKSLQQRIADLRTDKKEVDQQLAELEKTARKRLEDFESTRRSEENLSADLKRQSRLCEELSSQLAQKEFTLAKAFGVIRRLESILAEMLPEAVAGISREVPGYPEAKEEEAPATDDVEISTRPAPQQAPAEADAADAVLRARLAEEAAAALKSTQQRPLPARIEDAPKISPAAEQEILAEVGDALSMIVGDRPPGDLDPAEKAEISETVRQLSSELEKRLAPESPEIQASPAAETPRPRPPHTPPPAYTSDSGKEGNKTPLPPEGEVHPLPPPWQRKVKGFFQKYFSSGDKNPDSDTPPQ